MRITQAIREVLADGAKAMIRIGGTGMTTLGDSGFLRADLLGGKRREERDWKGEVGDLWSSNLVLSCLNWQARQVPRARPVVRRPGPEGKLVEVPGAPALPLIVQPCAYMTARNLWAGVLLSLNVEGDAYLWPQRDGFAQITALHYLPHWMVEPKASGDVAAPVSHYEYRPDGVHVVKMYPIGTAPGDFEIIHIRLGVDPHRRWKGYGPLKTIFREVFTDEEAAAATATILENLGIAGAVYSPKSLPDDVDPAELVPATMAEEIKRKHAAATTGANRGSAIVLTIPFDVSFPNQSPQQLLLDKLRDVPEERVTAAMGIPAAVAGFGAGLAQMTNRATSDSLTRWAWENGVQPMCETIDEHLTLQLLPQIAGTQEGDACGRDYSKVDALQEQQGEKYKRLTEAVGGPWLTANEARAQENLPPVESGDKLPKRQAPVAPGQPAEEDADEEAGGKAARPFRGQVADRRPGPVVVRYP